jgi:Uma2 family endonuclease
MSAVVTPPALTQPTALPSAASGPRRFRFTREEYHKLGDLGFFRGKRVELIRGEIIEMCPMNEPHAQSILLALDALRAAFGAGFTCRPQLPLDFGDTEPQPDVAVVRGGPRDNTDTPTTALLVVEVADTTLLDDTTAQAELYATAGIPEYWVIDLKGKQLHVFRDPVPLPAGLGAIAYRSHQTLGSTDTVSPLAAPAATVPVADLLP